MDFKTFTFQKRNLHFQMKLSLFKKSETTPALLQLPPAPPARYHSSSPLSCRLAGLRSVGGGDLLLDMLLVLMLLKASTVEILDGNQPVGHAICGSQQPAPRRQPAGLLLLLPLHQEFLLLRSLDDIDPLSFINGVWWTSLSAPILTARPTSYIVSSPL